jgi:SAM-dependent methyltransferase
MIHDNDFEYYENMAHWSFDEYGIHEECLTDWDLYGLLRSKVTAESRVLDLGTAGGEKILSEFPDCAEILGTDYSPAMIATARGNLARSGRKNISFRVMDNLNMDVPDEHFDVVVARHTCTDAAQVLRCLKPGGHFLIRGVDKYDCWSLKLVFGGGQCFDDPVPVSITDYEDVLKAGFCDVELVPIFTREFFKDRESFRDFLGVVPILENVAIEGEPLDEDLLDKYIAENTVGGRIILRRAYYGISARKKI